MALLRDGVAQAFTGDVPRPQLEEAPAAQTQAIVGAVVGSVGFVTGAALLAVAHRRRATARLAPRVGPGFAGLALKGRF